MTSLERALDAGVHRTPEPPIRDPRTLARRRTLASAFVGLAVVLPALWFAIAPKKARALLPTPSRVVFAEPKATANSRRPLDLAPFRSARLVPRQDPQKTIGDASPAFMAGPLILIAIVDGPSGRRAALYGSVSDVFLLVKAGEVFGDVRVDAIDLTFVDVTQGAERKRLTLVDGPRGIGAAR